VFNKLGLELLFIIVLVKSLLGIYILSSSSALGLLLGVSCNSFPTKVCISLDYLAEIGIYFPVLILS